MLLLVEPVMYMLLAIAEKVGIKNVIINRGDDPEAEIDEPLTEEEAQVDSEQGREMRNMITGEEPQRFSDLKVNVAPDQLDQELIAQLENIDVSSIKESLMSRPQAPNMAEESLMARR